LILVWHTKRDGPWKIACHLGENSAISLHTTVNHITSTRPHAGLGLDAGGTQTRWALADAQGLLRAEGSVAALNGMQLDSADGRAHLQATLLALAQAAGPVQAVVAGITGFDATQLPRLCAIAAEVFKLPPDAIRAVNDVELAARAAFAPGAGYMVYAGTGSVAAFVDGQGQLHRAGGRGVVIDDAGGGHWIARQALQQVWRAEDAEPGAWRRSALAAQVFERVGGSDWLHTRQWAYGASRGELGTLALAVAAAAEQDPAALAILQSAGHELARLAQALLRRFGPRPIALGGRVFELHPGIEAALRAALPPGTQVHRLTTLAHHAAARWAATGSP
jgi:glucosamine kinase